MISTSGHAGAVIEVVGYRWADYDTPLWAGPNRGAGRWHHRGADATQYWALHPLGPWAEYARGQGVRDESGLSEITSRTWAAWVRFDSAAAVAIVDFDSAGGWGVTAAELVSDDHRATQELGASLRRRYQALVVPSADLPGTNNLVLFGPRALSPYHQPPPDPGTDVPAALTAERGQPPVGVLELVCHRGARHPAFTAWSEGSTFPVPHPRYTMV